MNSHLPRPAAQRFARLLRVRLCLLLSLAIPIHGYAALDAARPPCPMASEVVQPATAQHAVGLARTAVLAEHAACCNDADTATRTGKLCKGGQDCSSPCLGVAQARTELRFPGTEAALPVADVQSRVDAARVRIWRPPAPLLIV